MPLFEISNGKLASIEQKNFLFEKELQHIVEKNLTTIFNCRFVASEFSTGSQHAGRIDTLALSEDNNPVIIEYKKVESSELINQSLYYLSWIYDHKGDFEIAVQKILGKSVEVDWTDVRVICIAPNYKKFDLHAVQVIGANIELWQYRFFKNSTIYLEEVLNRSIPSPSNININDKNPKMVAAGKKAAITRANNTYTFEEHLENKSDKIKEIAMTLQEYIMGLDSSIEESPKKHYVAYKISQNFVCMEIQKQTIILWLKLKPGELTKTPEISRDVTNIGHHGTGDIEFTIRSSEDIETVKPFIETAYNKIGG